MPHHSTAKEEPSNEMNFINLTPYIPLSLTRRGGGWSAKGLRPFKLPLIREQGIDYIREASPLFDSPSQGIEVKLFKRSIRPLFTSKEVVY